MYYAIENNHVFTILREVTDNEEKIIKVSKEKFLMIEKEEIKYKLLHEAYHKYINSYEDGNFSEILSSISSYLGEIKSFIDGWDKTLSGYNDGKEKFNKKIKDLYDSNFEYRYIYNLRNCKQHTGTMNMKFSNSITNGIRITINNMKFMEEYKKMQSALKNDLAKCKDEETNINDVILKTHNLLTILNEEFVGIIIESNVDDLFQCSYNINNIYNNLDTKVETIYVIEYDGDLRNLEEKLKDSIKIKYAFNYNLASKILKNSVQIFKFVGKYDGKSESIPYMMNVNSLLEMPRFKTGARMYTYLGVAWELITGKTSYGLRDGYDKHMSVYVPYCLNMEYKKELEKIYIEEEKRFFNDRIIY